MSERSVSNLLILKPGSGNVGRFAHTVYQEDLEEIFALRKEAREAARSGDADAARVVSLMLKSKLLYIEAALRSSARVEPGAHSAELVPRGGRFFQCRRLEVR